MVNYPWDARGVSLLIGPPRSIIYFSFLSQKSGKNPTSQAPCHPLMEDYNGSRRYGEGTMQMESYYGPPPSRQPTSYDLRCYSSSYAETQMGNNRDLKLKKGKSTAGSFSKSWTFGDREFQRKKRIASYKMYTVEGKMKGSLRRSFRWLKDKYTEVLYGW